MKRKLEVNDLWKVKAKLAKNTMLVTADGQSDILSDLVESARYDDEIVKRCWDECMDIPDYKFRKLWPEIWMQIIAKVLQLNWMKEWKMGNIQVLETRMGYPQLRMRVKFENLLGKKGVMHYIHTPSTDVSGIFSNWHNFIHDTRVMKDELGWKDLMECYCFYWNTNRDDLHYWKVSF